MKIESSNIVSELLKSKGITKLYHFTDISNIQSIIDNGGLYSWKACNRNGITIQSPGGSNISRSLDDHRGLGNYVRLSFTENHPMMYVAQNDGRISYPVILEIDLAVVDWPTTKFSDRNATKNGAIVTGGYSGANNIHFQTVKQWNHFNLSVAEKEFYQAEVLVLEKVPLAYITNIDTIKLKLRTSSTLYSSGPSTYKPAPSYSYRTSSSSSSNTSNHTGCFWIIIIGIIVLLAIIAG